MKLSPRQRREIMVRDQICARGIKSQKVIDAMLEVPRHFFVAPDSEELAYGDHPVTIGFEQTISQPYMVASMTELLELEPEHKVLEIGTGSGYQTAILCSLAKMVYSVERIASLIPYAKEALERAAFDNFRIYHGDGSLGLQEEAPFDRIIVTASSPEIPQSLVDQLSPEGILIIPSGAEDFQHLYKIVKEEGREKEEKLYGCRFVKLIGQEGWSGK